MGIYGVERDGAPDVRRALVLVEGLFPGRQT